MWKEFVCNRTLMQPHSPHQKVARTLLQLFILKICQEESSRWHSKILVVRDHFLIHGKQSLEQSFRNSATAVLY